MRLKKKKKIRNPIRSNTSFFFRQVLNQIHSAPCDDLMSSDSFDPMASSVEQTRDQLLMSVSIALFGLSRSLAALGVESDEGKVRNAQ